MGWRLYVCDHLSVIRWWARSSLLGVIVALAGCIGGAQARTLDLRTVDWKNVSVPGAACRRSGSIQLRNGSALIPDSKSGHIGQPNSNGPRYDGLDELSPDVTYGDLEGSGHDEAALNLWCNNNGGTAGGAFLYSLVVYSGHSGRLQVVGLITPRQQPPDELPTTLGQPKIDVGTVTVPEYWYGARDGTCCPTGRATTTWRYSAGRLEAGQSVVTAKPA
jgi:hypothetical protein